MTTGALPCSIEVPLLPLWVRAVSYNSSTSIVFMRGKLTRNQWQVLYLEVNNGQTHRVPKDVDIDEVIIGAEYLAMFRSEQIISLRLDTKSESS